MIVTNNERYKLDLIKRVLNSAYEYETFIELSFKGRPANQIEKKNYRIQAGVHGGTDSVYVFCSNLPSQINIGDKIRYLGKEWTVESVGYYLENVRVLNPELFSEEALAKKCPKGITLK